MSGKEMKATHCSSICRISALRFSGFAFRCFAFRGLSSRSNSSNSWEASKFAFFPWTMVIRPAFSQRNRRQGEKTHIWNERRIQLLSLQLIPVNTFKPRMPLELLVSLPVTSSRGLFPCAPKPFRWVPIEELRCSHLT